MSKSARKSVLPAKPTHGYEFGGPYDSPFFTLLKNRLTASRLGAFAASFGLPLVCYLAAFLCNNISGCPAPSTLHPSSLTLETLKRETGWPGIVGLASMNATLWMLGYYALSLLLQAVLPGTEVEGVELATGGKLKYKFNGQEVIQAHHGRVETDTLQHLRPPSLSQALLALELSFKALTSLSGHSSGTITLNSLPQTLQSPLP